MTQDMVASAGSDGVPLTPAQARQVVETAVHAPSVHNTQPWQFAVDGSTVDVRADRRRGLPLQDPDGRELMLSCGGAVLHAWLAVRGLDRACGVSWLPNPADPDLLARLDVGPTLAATPEERRLLAAVLLRHTDRSAFASDPVPEPLLDDLRRAAEQEGAWLAAEQRPEQVVRLEVLVSRADRALRQDPGLQGEIGAWVRPGHHPEDGVPLGALPQHGQGRASSLALRDFEPADDVFPAGEQPPVAEHPLLLVLGTDGDTPLDWLRAGAALSRLLLTATGEGLVANPQSQVLEVPALRSQLVHELDLVGRPQLVLRVGWPTGAGSPHTGRRPMADVLPHAAPAAGVSAGAGGAA